LLTLADLFPAADFWYTAYKEPTAYPLPLNASHQLRLTHHLIVTAPLHLLQPQYSLAIHLACWMAEVDTVTLRYCNCDAAKAAGMLGSL